MRLHERPALSVNRRDALRMAGATAAAVGLAASGLGQAKAQAGGDIVGSWYALVRPPSGPVGALITLAADGTLTQTSTESPTTSPGHGAWQQTDAGQFLFIIRWFDFASDGTVVGSGKSRALVAVNAAGDTYSGQAQIDHFDLDGNVVDSHSAPAQATRILPEPLSS